MRTSHGILLALGLTGIPVSSGNHNNVTLSQCVTVHDMKGYKEAYMQECQRGVHGSARGKTVRRSKSTRRHLQIGLNCTGNANASLDTSCANGRVLVTGASSTIGSTSADCCICPAGTVAAYADESLAFRFRASDGIAQDSDGSLVWNAATPSGLSFVMNRTIVNGSTHWDEMPNSPLYDRSQVEPAIVTNSGGSSSGLVFEKADSYTGMYANASIAVGAKHTFFVVLTPNFATPGAYETIIAFRPLGYEYGLFGWYMGSMFAPSAKQRSVFPATWVGTGFNGPVVQPNVTQAVVSRSYYGVNDAGVEGPVVESAVIRIFSTSMQLTWIKDTISEGLKQYNFDQDEEFDFDFRDPVLDKKRVVGCGYMSLGHQLPDHDSFALQGTVHHIELHSATLSNAQVLHVLRQLRHTVGGATAPPECANCSAGTSDADSNPATPCALCPVASFSNQTGVVNCTGSCPLGSTILSTGEISVMACAQCEPGQYGAVSASAHAVCEPCPAGRISSLSGAANDSSCVSCAAGQFSQSGSTSCAPSGCTDKWADNYNPTAVVDEGLCTYTCSTLRERAGQKAGDAGGCVLHDAKLGWRRHAHNGTVVGIDGFRESWSELAELGRHLFRDCPLTGGKFQINLRLESWVVQGRPLAGSTRAAVVRAHLPCELTGGKILTVRYILHHNDESVLWWTRDPGMHDGGNVLFEHVESIRGGGQSYKSAAFYVDTGPTDASIEKQLKFSVKDSVMRNNRLPLEAGLPYGTAGNINYIHTTWTRTRFEQNEVAKDGGALFFGFTGTAMVDSCAFIGNKALQGGAIAVQPGLAGFLLTVKKSLFRDNIATGGKGGGDIFSNQLLTVSIEDTVLNGGTAVAVGAALYFDQPTSVRVLHTTFSPMLDGAGTVFLSGRLGDCEQHPCGLGHSCSYANYSLTCTPCDTTTVSRDGLQCVACPAGKEPNQNSTECVPCTGNSFSLYGVCMPCVGQANDDRSQCQDCSLHQIADPPELGCRCDDGHYNASLGGGSTKLHVCFWSGWDAEEQSSAIAKHTDKKLDCSQCPSDAMLNPCLVCKGSGTWIAPGFTTPPIANSKDGSFVSVFRCHRDIEIARKRCPGTAGSRRLTESEFAMNSQCAEGYAGHICGECDDDWGMNTNRECEPCESGSSSTVGSVFILLGMIAGICIVLGIIAKVWSAFPLKHLLRCSVQPMRILITYSQVTTQLGDVLNFVYPGLFGDVLDFLKPVLDIWGLLFRALGPSECFGVQGFTSSWLLRVLVLPLIMSAFVIAIYFVERCRGSGTDDAAMNAKGNFFFVIFFCYPTICIISFAAFLCTPMTPDISVLDTDDTVQCEDGAHVTMQILSYIVIAVVAVGLPCALLFVLTRKTATYERETQSSHLDTAKRIAVELEVDVQTAAFVIRDVTVGRDFSFVMDAYDPRYLYWEAIDMFRKLALVGLVLLVGRGTVAQLSIAVILAFGFFAAHVKCWPYKVYEDNMFRAATELHVFIAIMAAMVMKNDLKLETVQEGVYDWLLFLSFLVLIPLGFCVTVISKVCFVMASLREIDGDDAREKRRRAFDLHVLGLGSDEDKADLRRYVNGWLVKKEYAAFLSHFKAEAAAEARILKLELERGLRVSSDQVFLDADNLSDLRELLECVKQSDAFVLMLTDGVLSRPWCLAELDAAVKGDVPIVVLRINNAFRCDPVQIQHTLATLPQYLAKKNPDALRQLMPLELDPATMGGSILDAINTAEALTFDPNQSSVMMRAQIHQLATAMVTRACPENKQLLSFLDLSKVEPDPWVVTRKVAAYIVFAEKDIVVRELATKVKVWFTQNGLSESQIMLITEADIPTRDMDSMILLQTKQAIEEPRCLVHLFRATSNSVPVVPICLSSSSAKHAAMMYDFEAAVPFLEGLQGNLDPSERAKLETAVGATTAEVGLELARSIPNIISKPLAIDSLDSQFKAQMLDIELTLRRNLATGHIAHGQPSPVAAKVPASTGYNAAHSSASVKRFIRPTQDVDTEKSSPAPVARARTPSPTLHDTRVTTPPRTRTRVPASVRNPPALPGKRP